jgi:hypothetical protein
MVTAGIDAVRDADLCAFDPYYRQIRSDGGAMMP